MVKNFNVLLTYFDLSPQNGVGEGLIEAESVVGSEHDASNEDNGNMYKFGDAERGNQESLGSNDEDIVDALSLREIDDNQVYQEV